MTGGAAGRASKYSESFSRFSAISSGCEGENFAFLSSRVEFVNCGRAVGAGESPGRGRLPPNREFLDPRDMRDRQPGGQPLQDPQPLIRRLAPRRDAKRGFGGGHWPSGRRDFLDSLAMGIGSENGDEEH